MNVTVYTVMLNQHDGILLQCYCLRSL